MKEKKPTKRDISKILKRRVAGWNDKRLNYNRIKLTERLSHNEMQLLEEELSDMHKGYAFCCGNTLWNSMLYSSAVVSFVKFWKK